MTSTEKAKKIEGIFPLTYMQEGLLFHHLSSSWDQGYLNIECTLRGNLKTELFENSCQILIKRHETLRTSVVWENLAKPVRVIHSEKKMNIEYLDWTSMDSETQHSYWNDLKSTCRESGLNFTKGALLNIKLAKIQEDCFRLLWPSHHLLVDGWSSSIILKDLFTIYDSLYTDKSPMLEVLPSHKSYLTWLNKFSLNEAKDFWSSYLNDLDSAPLFDSNNQSVSGSIPKVEKLHLTKELTTEIVNLAKSYRVTVNTVIQGVWSIVLSRFFGTSDVTYGATTSGRSGDFPNISLMSGMFVNVQPVRTIIADEVPFSDWFSTYQKRQREASKYEHINMDQIASFINWPSITTMFDSLLIFENYPRLDTAENTVKISDYRSGVTSTYPVTMTITPGEEMHLALSVLPEVVVEKSAKWILSSLVKILELLTVEKVGTFKELKLAIPRFESPPMVGTAPNLNVDKKNVLAPRNGVEEKLVEIWSSLFGRKNIAVDDSFFEIGGKSLLAVKMFSIINEEFGSKLPPTTLLEHPTIAAIANVISVADSKVESFKNLVTLQPDGSGQPLFCLHAGGAHVFFYNSLANYLKEKRPVYALRPSGLYENEQMHQSIEEMAVAYVREIRTKHPEGPYNLLVYCFSTAVGFEMANLLRSMNQRVNLIVMDTMAEQEQLTTTRFSMRAMGFVKRFMKSPFRVINIMVSDRVKRYIKPLWINLIGSEEEKKTSITTKHLLRLYNRYKWKPFKVAITLILTKKPTDLFNEELITSWEKLCSKVNVFHTKGNHRTLFEEPDVRFVSEKIDEAILE